MIRFCVKCPDNRVFGCTIDGINYYCEDCAKSCKQVGEIIGSVCNNCIQEMEAKDDYKTSPQAEMPRC